jgi:predicted nucleic acid-binding protein
MTVLDTCVVSNYLKRDSVERWPALHGYVAELLRADHGPLAISYVTLYELRRGLEKDRLRGNGRRKRVVTEKFLRNLEILGLDDGRGAGWDMAGRWWAELDVNHPNEHKLSDADLLIATTAAFHRRAFVTTDRRLFEGLKAIDFPPSQLTYIDLGS